MNLHQFMKLDNKARELNKELLDFEILLQEYQVFVIDKEGDKYYITTHEDYTNYSFLGYKFQVTDLQ